MSEKSQEKNELENEHPETLGIIPYKRKRKDSFHVWIKPQLPQTIKRTNWCRRDEIFDCSKYKTFTCTMWTTSDYLSLTHNYDFLDDF